MKLYEFVNKIEAMGEVEKKTEALNESVDASFWGDFWDGPSKRLNESSTEDAYDVRDGSIRDEFYSLIDGMDPVDVVDMMVSYFHMNEYEMEDLIKSIRGEVSVADDMKEE